MLCNKELNDEVTRLNNEILKLHNEIKELKEKFKLLDKYCDYHNKRDKSGLNKGCSK